MELSNETEVTKTRHSVITVPRLYRNNRSIVFYKSVEGIVDRLAENLRPRRTSRICRYRIRAARRHFGHCREHPAP